MSSATDEILLEEINKLDIIPVITSLGVLEVISNGFLFRIIHNFVSEKKFKMTESTLATFRMASRFSLAITDLGYLGKLHYQNFLIPNLGINGDTRHILSWLFFKQNKETKSTSKTLLQNAFLSEIKKNYRHGHLDNKLFIYNLIANHKPVKFDDSNIPHLEKQISKFEKMNRKIKLKIKEYNQRISKEKTILHEIKEQLKLFDCPTEIIEKKIEKLTAKIKNTEIELSELPPPGEIEIIQLNLNKSISEENELNQKIREIKLEIENFNLEENSTDESKIKRAEYFGRIKRVSDSLQRQKLQLVDIYDDIDKLKEETDQAGAELEKKFNATKQMLLSGKKMFPKIYITDGLHSAPKRW